DRLRGRAHRDGSHGPTWRVARTATQARAESFSTHGELRRRDRALSRGAGGRARPRGDQRLSGDVFTLVEKSPVTPLRGESAPEGRALRNVSRPLPAAAGQGAEL